MSTTEEKKGDTGDKNPCRHPHDETALDPPGHSFLRQHPVLCILAFLLLGIAGSTFMSLRTPAQAGVTGLVRERVGHSAGPSATPQASEPAAQHQPEAPPAPRVSRPSRDPSGRIAGSLSEAPRDVGVTTYVDSATGLTDWVKVPPSTDWVFFTRPKGGGNKAPKPEYDPADELQSSADDGSCTFIRFRKEPVEGKPALTHVIVKFK